MVVNTTLTESMLARLAKIPESFKENGEPGDPTRLVSSWKGALDEDKVELEKIVTDKDLGAAFSATKIKEEYPKFRIYTTACIQNAIGNYRKEAKEIIDDRAESKL